MNDRRLNPGETTGADRWPLPTDVIVPIYGGGEALNRCLESLVVHTDFELHRLVLVLDGPQEEDVRSTIAELRARPDLELVVLRNPQRSGFVSSVNRGMELSARDVVLVNSDAEVSSKWIEKLQRAIASKPRIATASALSNNASICSIPRLGVENLLPAGWDVTKFAALVDRVSQRNYPYLPTGVGVCMYIRRTVLSEVGLFDEELFGVGYGEESEFCMRADEAGYRHVAADDLFVYHRGQTSFGRSRASRVRRAHRIIRRRYPSYLPRVARWLAIDPLADLRQDLVSELRATRESHSAKPRVLHVVHGWPPFSHGGTESYARWLALRQARERETTVFARYANPDRASGEIAEMFDNGVSVRLMANHFDQRNPLARNALWSRKQNRDFRRFLDDVNPDVVHVHHLAGHVMSILREVRHRKIPIVLQLQDWWLVCARANLTHRNGVRCTGPRIRKCSSCLPLTRVSPRGFWNFVLYAARRALARAVVREAELSIAGSAYLVQDLKRFDLLPPSARVQVVPYGVELADVEERVQSKRPPGHPLRLGFIGSLLSHKGLHVATRALRNIAPEDAVLEVWGNQSLDPLYVERSLQLAGSARVVIHEPFPDAAKADILRGLDVLLVPSVGLESFGLVLREAFRCGTPVIASRCGAPEELLLETGAGALFDSAKPEELTNWILHLIDHPDRIAEWRGKIPRILGMDEHSAQIDRLYGELASVEERP